MTLHELSHFYGAVSGVLHKKLIKVQQSTERSLVATMCYQ